jgi:TatD DNase family protein
MLFIDTHCHIYLEEFQNDRKQVLLEAEKAGIIRIFMPAIDSATHSAMIKVEKEYLGKCYSMMGLHPCSVKENWQNELKITEEYLKNGKFYAIGETGLDFYWDLTYTKEQYMVFEKQIEWSLDYKIPLVIHSRNSLDECIKTIKNHQKGKLNGIFHCFSGTIDQAQKITDLGFYLGIGGVLTFKNSGLDKVMEQISMEHIVLETDAPYLAPVPFRGKRNECSYLKYVVQKLAEIKKITVEEAAEITTINAEKIFGGNS